MGDLGPDASTGDGGTIKVMFTAALWFILPLSSASEGRNLAVGEPILRGGEDESGSTIDIGPAELWALVWASGRLITLPDGDCILILGENELLANVFVLIIGDPAIEPVVELGRD